jgi:hypothetical protein
MVEVVVWVDRLQVALLRDPVQHSVAAVVVVVQKIVTELITMALVVDLAQS